jgi:hypothetical protein
MLLRLAVCRGVTDAVALVRAARRRRARAAARPRVGARLRGGLAGSLTPVALPEKKVDFEDSDDEADRKDGGEVDIQAAHDKNM